MLNGTNHPAARELAEKLAAARHHNHWMARCPAHVDDMASLSIKEAGGRVLVHCHAGCSQDAVIGALRDRGLWPDRPKTNGDTKPRVTIVATYDYVDTDGTLVFQVVRYAPKDFRQRRPDGKRGWVWKAATRVVPYRLPEVQEAIASEHPVFIVEGEKDVENLAKLGIVATCNAGGAGKWRAEHVEYLKGADVIIVPDNDDPGRQHAENVAASLTGIAARVRILTLPELPPKGDVSNWIEAGGTAEQLWALAEEAAECRETGAAQPGAATRESEVAPAGTADRPSQATVLADIAGGEKVELFRTPDGVSYADLYINGHRETWPVRSKAFKWWLRGVYYERTRGAPNSEAMTTALDLIEARAQFGGIARPVYLCVAEHEGCIYVNLCDTAWRAVKVSSGSWCVVDEPPVRFCRRVGMLELPEPVPGGKLDELDNHLRMNASGYTLTKAWLLAALRPRGPYPVLAFTGEQGTAKSTTLRMLRHLVDPNTAPLRAPPDTTRDLYVAAINGHVITLDNVTSLTADVSDALCRLSTGGGFSTRSLYTNDEELLFDGHRPVGITSIAEAAVRPDLLDRTLGVRLEVIPDNDRKLEDDLWAAFDAARPRILGALYDALAHGLKHLDGTRPNRLPRMADFARWSIACEPAYQAAGTFMAAYDEYREEAIDIVLDSDLVADALRRHMKACPPGAFGFAEIETTSKELLELLTANVPEPQRRRRYWPQTPEGLAHRLVKLAPALRQAGIVMKRGSRQGKRRPIVIRDSSPREVGA